MDRWALKLAITYEFKFLILSYAGDSIPNVLWLTRWVFLSGSQCCREQKGWACPLPGVTNLSKDPLFNNLGPFPQHHIAKVAEADSPSSSSWPSISCTCCLKGIPLHPSILQPQPAEMPPSLHNRKIQKRRWDSIIPSFFSLKESNPCNTLNH